MVETVVTINLNVAPGEPLLEVRNEDGVTPTPGNTFHLSGRERGSAEILRFVIANIGTGDVTLSHTVLGDRSFGTVSVLPAGDNIILAGEQAAYQVSIDIDSDAPLGDFAFQIQLSG